MVYSRVFSRFFARNGKRGRERVRAPWITDHDDSIFFLSSADQRRRELKMSMEKGTKKPPSNGAVVMRK